MFNCKEVPSISLEFLNEDPVRVNSGWLIRCWWQNTVVQFRFIEVAFETSKACGEAVEEDRQVVLILHFAFRHHRRHIEPKTSCETFIKVPGLYNFGV